jgi:hypothetical protein
MATGSEAIRLPQLLILLHFISVATRLPIAGHVLTQLGRQRQEAQEEDQEGIPHAEANVVRHAGGDEERPGRRQRPDVQGSCLVSRCWV